MAEFCLKCHNKMFNTNYKHQDVIEDLDICEGCGKYKYCVVSYRGWGLIDIIERIHITLSKKKVLEMENLEEDILEDTEDDTLDL